MNMYRLFLAAAYISISGGCTPSIERRWSAGAKSQVELKVLVHDATQIALPDAAYVLEACSYGARDSTFFCLVSAPKTVIDVLLASTDEKLGPRSNQSAFFDTFSIPPSTCACFSALRMVRAEHHLVFAYPRGGDHLTHDIQMFVLVVPERALFIVIRPDS